MSSLTSSPHWQSLKKHQEEIKDISLDDLFSRDPDRHQKFSLELDGLFLDYSKNNITDQTLELLIDLAASQNVESWRDKMFSGDPINVTEIRAVRHVALRSGQKSPQEVQDVLSHMSEFSKDVRDGRWTGHTGQKITDIVHIGIGGSALGPEMVCAALEPYAHPDLDIHFISNVDGGHITQTLKHCKPETTLFIVASKTFATQETLANAHTAKSWLLATLEDERAVAKHFVALSTNAQAVTEFGIDPENMFIFWDWVGGRYSVWSAIGLPVMLSIGPDNFKKFLEGAHITDTHFQTAPLNQNMPVILALLGIWYRNFWDRRAIAVLPYDHSLRLFPRWLQQVDMESNGKRIDRNGDLLDYKTGPVVFGDAGTDAQHSFFQLLHQGTDIIPCDFIAPKTSQNPTGEHHTMLLSNFLAQTEALMTGRKHDDPNRSFPGNRPTNTLLLDTLDPKRLGMLMALYEHKIFVQGIVWNINSFDQFGVELGKHMANTLLDEIKTGHTGQHDSSTAGLLRRL